MREILVIRFGALGDLCVLGWALARLADAAPAAGCRVTLVTKAAFAPLLAEVRGVDEVVTLDGSGLGALVRLASRLRRRRWDVVIDAHGVLRAHLLLLMLGRRPERRLAKDTAARLQLLAGGASDASDERLQRHMRDRFDDLFVELRGPAAGPAARPPLAHLNGAGAGSTDPVVPTLGVAPGAQWDPKRWPEENFAALVRRFRDETGGDVRIYLGPRESVWAETGSLAAAVRADDRLAVVQLPDLTDVARSLAAADVVATNDSGLMHLAEAVGTPVLAFFGPTVREFGYFPQLPASRVMQTDLACRPCSRNGKRPCHRGDLACLREITVERAGDALVRMLIRDGDR